MTCEDSDVNSCLQSALSVLAGVFFRVGILARAWAMHAVKFGGSLGTITGWPGLDAAWPFASTYIQWLNALRLIGLPATTATELPGMLEPQAEMATATSTKKAPSAGMDLRVFIRLGG